MKRKIFLSIMLIASIGLLVCSLKENTQPQESPSSCRCLYYLKHKKQASTCSTKSTPVSEEEKEISLTRMQIADREIDKILKETKNLNQEDQAQAVYDYLIELAEHGTEDAPYSLIIKNSICKKGNMISFMYAGGILGGVWLVDKDYWSKCN